MSQQPITLYTTPHCGYCHAAKRLLANKELEYTEINLQNEAPHVRTDLMELTQQRTVPQIFIGDTFIGGFDDMNALNSSGELDKLIYA